MMPLRTFPFSDFDFLTTLSLRTIGNFMVLSCLFLIGKTIYQPAIEELRFFLNTVTRTEYTVEASQEETQPATGQFARMFGERRIEVLVPEDPEFSLVIPKIGANARVVKNVDPGDDKAYLEALKNGIAHAYGTAFPGEGGHVFLFAHSTDYIWNIGSYNAVFYLLYKLEAGDEVNVFYRGKRHKYIVRDKKVIESSDVQYLTRKTEEETLTLQTCWPPGTTLKRLIVHADLKTL